MGVYGYAGRGKVWLDHWVDLRILIEIRYYNEVVEDFLTFSAFSARTYTVYLPPHPLFCSMRLCKGSTTQ